MPHLEKPYEYIPLPKYPHMRHADAAIWERFVKANPDRFTQVFYDYRVGDHAHNCNNCLDCARSGWYDLTRWAIDVVAEDANAIYIIEVKPAANAKALGQAIAYTALFLREHTVGKQVIPVVLTDHEISSTRWVSKMQGVELWVA